MFMFFCVVAVINFCLGYALALHFGPDLVAWRRGPGRDVADQGETARKANVTGVMSEPTFTPAALPRPSPAPAEARAPASAPASGATAPASTSPDAPRTKGFLESSIEILHRQIVQYGAELSQIESDIRRLPTAADAVAMEPYRARLRQTNDEFVTSQTAANDLLRDERDTLGELTYLADNIELSVDERLNQIEAAGNSAAEEQTPLTRTRLLNEIVQHVSASHKLRDTLSDAWLVLARHEGRLAAIESQLLTDPLTGIASRAGLTAALEQWRLESDSAGRSASAAILDLDQFTAVNDRYGPQVGDKVLCAVAKAMHAAIRTDDLDGRSAGQQFIVFLPDTPPPEAGEVMDGVRQAIAATHFEDGEAEICVTATCAVVTAEPNETAEAHFERLAAALALARQAGRNHTLVAGGQVLAPVAAIAVPLEAQALPV